MKAPSPFTSLPVEAAFLILSPPSLSPSDFPSFIPCWAIPGTIPIPGCIPGCIPIPIPMPGGIPMPGVIPIPIPGCIPALAIGFCPGCVPIMPLAMAAALRASRGLLECAGRFHLVHPRLHGHAHAELLTGLVERFIGFVQLRLNGHRRVGLSLLKRG